MNAAAELVDSNGESWSRLLTVIDIENSFEKAEKLIETIDSMPELTKMMQALIQRLQNIRNSMGSNAQHKRTMDDIEWKQMGMYLKLQEGIEQRREVVQAAQKQEAGMVEQLLRETMDNTTTICSPSYGINDMETATTLLGSQHQQSSVAEAEDPAADLTRQIEELERQTATLLVNLNSHNQPQKKPAAIKLFQRIFFLLEHPTLQRSTDLSGRVDILLSSLERAQHNLGISPKEWAEALASRS